MYLHYVVNLCNNFSVKEGHFRYRVGNMSTHPFYFFSVFLCSLFIVFFVIVYTFCMKLADVYMSSILWMPFFMCFIVTFIDFTYTFLMIGLSLPAYLRYSELNDPNFLVRSSVIYNVSEFF